MGNASKNLAAYNNAGGEDEKNSEEMKKFE